ncbi:MAG: hypothetical protein AAGA44_03500 [Pseudomonadota bacterium]
MKRLAITVILSLAVSSAAQADTSLGVKVGTLGLGIEGTYDLSEKWGLRGAFNQYDYSYEDDLDGVDYDGDLELSSISLLADFRPFETGFRLSGGVILNDNRIQGVALPADFYDIGDQTYTQAEVGVLSATADFDDVAPYFGIGYDFNRSSNLRFNVDLGVLVQGSSSVQILSTGGTLSNDPAFQSELDAEAIAYEDDLEDYDLYPVLALGVSYAFE